MFIGIKPTTSIRRNDQCVCVRKRWICHERLGWSQTAGKISLPVIIPTLTMYSSLSWNLFLWIHCFWNWRSFKKNKTKKACLLSWSCTNGFLATRGQKNFKTTWHAALASSPFKVAMANSLMAHSADTEQHCYLNERLKFSTHYPSSSLSVSTSSTKNISAFSLWDFNRG